MEEKEYRFEFMGTIGGIGFVTASNEEEARKKILDNDVDDIINTWDMEIKEITKIEEEK